jgi:hypothetical protein
MLSFRRILAVLLVIAAAATGPQPARSSAQVAPASPQADVFEVFTNADFGGSRCWSTGAESANIHATCNDQISSIRVQPGWAARVFRDQNQAGPSRCFVAADANLGDNTFQDGTPLNDAISSFALVAASACAPGSPLEVFNDGAFQATMCWSSGAERANIHAFCADQISSLLIRSGWTVWLFRDANQGGPSICLSGSDADLSDNRYSDGTAVNDTASSLALSQQAGCPGITPIPPPPPPPSGVRFFWQGDPAWRDLPLRSCTGVCSKIGPCGCTLTSAAMLFATYGAALNPGTLSACMGSRACPFYWGTGAACSQGKAQVVGSYAFSWQMLESQINTYQRPVILGMRKGNTTHWVLVYKGSGAGPDNYTINDPGYKGGAANTLSANYRSWTYQTIMVYKRTGALADPTAPLPATTDPIPAPAPSGTPDQTLAPSQLPTALSGTVLIYARDETAMTIELSVAGSPPEAVEVLISSPNTPNTIWQPYSQYVTLPTADAVTVTFRTSSEQAGPYTSTITPVVEVPGGRFAVSVPLLMR